jgi:hypothetical protein
MDVQEKRRSLRLLIVAATAFACSIVALNGTLHAFTYEPTKLALATEMGPL